jgi:hypothetical protein
MNREDSNIVMNTAPKLLSREGIAGRRTGRQSAAGPYHSAASVLPIFRLEIRFDRYLECGPGNKATNPGRLMQAKPPVRQA